MLVSNGLESDLRQGIRSVGHRRHDDRHDTGQVSVPRRTLLVFTMTPHTSRLLVLTHSDATNPIPSAAQHKATTDGPTRTGTGHLHGPGPLRPSNRSHGTGGSRAAAHHTSSCAIGNSAVAEPENPDTWRQVAKCPRRRWGDRPAGALVGGPCRGCRRAVLGDLRRAPRPAAYEAIASSTSWSSTSVAAVRPALRILSTAVNTAWMWASVTCSGFTGLVRSGWPARLVVRLSRLRLSISGVRAHGSDTAARAAVPKPSRCRPSHADKANAEKSAHTPPRLRKDVWPAVYHSCGTPVLAEWIAGRAP